MKLTDLHDVELRSKTIKTSTVRHKRYGGNSVPGVVFSPHNAQNGFNIPIVLVEKKHTKLMYQMPWLYQ